MASSSRSKRRNSIEPITVDELLGAAGMSGFVSFLNVKPEDYGRPAPPPDATIEAESGATVAAALPATVEAEPSPTVEAGPAAGGKARVSQPVASSASTVVIELPAMVEGKPASMVEPVAPATIEADQASTIVDRPATTIEPRSPATIEGSTRPAFWTIEGIGGVFPASRLRRIERAQDVLTHVEESVYDVLWGVKDLSRDRSRVVAMGYEQIARRARASKRGVVDIIHRLIQKGFIEIVRAPITFGERRPAEYRVFGYAAVREDQRAKNRVWTIRTGNGVGYALPLSVEFPSASTIEAGASSTVATGQASTVYAGERATVGTGEPSTVAPASAPTYRDTKISQNTTTATPAVVAAIHETMGRADEDAAGRIVEACRLGAPDVTGEEIAYFIRREGPALRRNRTLDNPMGVLIRHIPRCCRGESLRLYRESVREERDRERRQVEGWLRDAREMLSKPDTPAMDRAWAEDIVATYGGAGKS